MPREFSPSELSLLSARAAVPSIAELWLYPVKSCGGIRVEAAGLAAYGMLYDRMFMLVDESGGHITQREFPSLAVVLPEISGEIMTLRAEGMNDVQIRLDVESDEVRPVSIWGHHSSAHDAGDVASAWFSEYLHAPVRLVRIGGQFRRTVDSGIITFVREVAFSDSYPLLIISRASLAALNKRLGAPVPMNRFRPNIVVENAAELHFGKQCSRCVMTTIEQSTGRPVGKEPLAALSVFRRDHRGKVVFGAYFAHVQPGAVLREGDEITVAETDGL
jgi:uncharacterized protein YcbX